MRSEDFDYVLPPERIAQRPAEPRDSARLLVLERASGEISHHVFCELPQLLAPEDLLVVNSTRVIAARLEARKVPTGGKAEILLLRRLGAQRWEALVGGKRLKVGARLRVEGGPEARVLEDLGGARRLVEFDEAISDRLKSIGSMPLPPYIKTPLRDPDEYQTVYARSPGSAAAPTAGLHFTPELIGALEAGGVGFVEVTLHIGLDTFAPVTEDDPRTHAIHTEWCEVTRPVVEQAAARRSRGGRVVGVGTTTVRTLESAARAGEMAPFSGFTDLYILPGFQFHAVDALITNFHLPRSTLLMLVSAFAGRDLVLHAYDVAIREGYRFYSFGDAMLIL